MIVSESGFGVAGTRSEGRIDVSDGYPGSRSLSVHHFTSSCDIINEFSFPHTDIRQAILYKIGFATEYATVYICLGWYSSPVHND